MSDRRTVSTASAPKAIGPYSQGVVAHGFVYTAGQIALDPQSGLMVGSGDVARETERVLESVKAILAAAGTTLEQVVRCEVFLADLADFGAMNEVYGRYFPSNAPARVTVQAARLPKDARVEIAAIAALP